MTEPRQAKLPGNCWPQMIEIRNLTRRPVNKLSLERLAKKVLKRENRTLENLSIVLTGRKRIRLLNKNFRKKDSPTDVLAFGSGLNEIVLCPAVIGENSKKSGLSFDEELQRALVHGILHALGHEHGAEMFLKQESYLK